MASASSEGKQSPAICATDPELVEEAVVSLRVGSNAASIRFSIVQILSFCSLCSLTLRSHSKYHARQAPYATREPSKMIWCAPSTPGMLHDMPMSTVICANTRKKVEVDSDGVRAENDLFGGDERMFRNLCHQLMVMHHERNFSIQPSLLFPTLLCYLGSAI